MKKERKKRNRNRAESGYSMQILEQQLNLLWQAPEPKRREAFLTGRPQAAISHMAFILTQAAYIHKWVWVLSVAVFGTLVGITAGWQQDALGAAAAMMPYLALLAAQEHTRSAIYGMTELELATRFSLKSVVLARMGLLGSFHLALLLLLLPIFMVYGQTGFLQTGIYLLVPYLLTTFLSLAWSRRMRGREILYLCLGTAVMVSSLQLVGSSWQNWYGEHFFLWWVLALVLLAVGNSWECYQTACRADRGYEAAV